MQQHVSRIVVRYAETDAMAVVHHASYLVWFEVGRTEWLAALGYSYAAFEQRGYFLVVSEVGVRYGQPARYGDVIHLVTRLSERRSRALRFDYEVRHADDDRLLARGHTRHILTDHEGQIRSFPADMMELLLRPPSAGEASA